MVLGYHIILSAYGFWLPNDPRGSWSATVREYELRAFGEATKVTTTRSVARQSHDTHARLAAKQSLRYPPVQYTGEQARAIARGFTIAAQERDYIIHALAILPDHVHLVLARHEFDLDRIAAHLMAKATAQMNAENIHPLAAYASPSGRVPSPWARGYWAPFIDSAEHMRAAIRYVENNPLRAGCVHSAGQSCRRTKRDAMMRRDLSRSTIIETRRIAALHLCATIRGASWGCMINHSTSS